MKDRKATLALVLALLALGFAIFQPEQKGADNGKSAFERVMRTRTLRCAYAVWPPYFMIDPNTKEMSGINHDVVEAIGHVTGLKIEWREEAGYGAFPTNLRGGKQDAFCSGVRLSAARAQRVEVTAPIAYAPLYAYVRGDDTRFDGHMAAADDPGVSIATVDGSTIEAVAKISFPKAKLHAMPEMSDEASVLDAVAAGKADIVFTEAADIVFYNKNNPAKQLKRVPKVPPLRTLAAIIPVGKGEWELRDLLNAALSELHGDGTIDRLITKYEPMPGAILRVSRPYEEENNAQQ